VLLLGVEVEALVQKTAEMELTLHGKIANLPAQEVQVVVDREAPYTIRIRGRVDERMFYGPKFSLQTELALDPGATTFRITDVITNHGAQEQEFEMLYHTNFGPPLLGQGSRHCGPVQQVKPNRHHKCDVCQHIDRQTHDLEQPKEIDVKDDHEGEDIENA